MEKKSERKTTVLISPETAAFAQRQEMKYTGILRAAPRWYVELLELKEDNEDMKKNISAYQKRVADLVGECEDLRRFKEKVKETMRAQARNGGI